MARALSDDPAIRRAVIEYPTWSIPDDPPARLQLIDEFRQQSPASGAFAGIDALFVQHHLGPLIPRIGAMMEDGLDPAGCWFVDIPYSTHNRVRTELIALGTPEKQHAPLFDDPLRLYERSQLKRLASVLRELAERRNRRLLVVDDGGYFLRGLRSLREAGENLIPAFAGRTHGVEQTTRGHRHLLKSQGLLAKLRMPVVSIARCVTKTFIESPFIGASVARAVLTALTQGSGSEGRHELGRVLVMGFGPVGRETVSALQTLGPHEPIQVVDTNPLIHSAIDAAGAKPFKTLPPKGPYDLVIGCTGYASFPLEARALLADRALLASGSSAAVEFNREGFVELANADFEDDVEVVDPNGTRARGIHATIVIREMGLRSSREFSFLNAGFPVNFDGRIECIPARAIQATHTLLFAACRQTLRAKTSGLRMIDPQVDRTIGTRAVELL